jgi:hypothetical protein
MLIGTSRTAVVDGMLIFGTHDENTQVQLARVARRCS